MSFTKVDWNLRHPGTTEVVDTKTQEFHGCEEAYNELGMLFKYGSIKNYQFFSDDSVSMIKYSSQWFNGNDKEECSKKSNKKQVEWFSNETLHFYDIGYAEKVSLFKEKKNLPTTKTRDENSFTTIPCMYSKAFLNLPDASIGLPLKKYSLETETEACSIENDTCQTDSRNLKNEIGETTIAKIIVKDAGDNHKKKEIKKITRLYKTTRRLRSANVLSKERFPRNKPFKDINQKIATSRFGRTRRVIDFSSVDFSDL